MLYHYCNGNTDIGGAVQEHASLSRYGLFITTGLSWQISCDNAIRPYKGKSYSSWLTLEGFGFLPPKFTHWQTTSFILGRRFVGHEGSAWQDEFRRRTRKTSTRLHIPPSLTNSLFWYAQTYPGSAPLLKNNIVSTCRKQKRQAHTYVGCESASRKSRRRSGHVRKLTAKGGPSRSGVSKRAA